MRGSAGFSSSFLTALCAAFASCFGCADTWICAGGISSPSRTTVTPRNTTSSKSILILPSFSLQSSFNKLTKFVP